MNLAEILASQTKAPDHTFVLPKTAWRTEYAKRPRVDLAVGLRSIGIEDTESIRKQAQLYAIKMYRQDDGSCLDEEARLDAFSEACMWWIAGRACCDPNDTGKSFFEREEETARVGLTPDGIRFIFDEYERYRIIISPITRLATGDDLTKLAARLTDGTSLAKLDEPTRVRLLKFASRMVEDFEDIEEEELH